MAMIFTDLAHRFFFWRRGRKSDSAEDRDQKSYSAFVEENEITHARLSHFAAQLGHMRMRSSTRNQKP